MQGNPAVYGWRFTAQGEQRLAAHLSNRNSASEVHLVRVRLWLPMLNEGNPSDEGKSGDGYGKR